MPKYYIPPINPLYYKEPFVDNPYFDEISEGAYMSDSGFSDDLLRIQAYNNDYKEIENYKSDSVIAGGYIY